jgi:arylsulfatase A-like enzyme
MRGASWQRPLSFALSILLLSACAARTRPNVVLVVIDTARADRFPWGGYDRPTAPALTAFAREGAVYTQAFSPAPWTVPAHASLFTGQYPSLHRTDCGSLRLPDGAVTLAESFREAGYRTLGYTANPWIGRTYNFDQGFETYAEVWREVPKGGEGAEDAGAALTNEKAIRFLHWRHESPEGRRQPFFLFINYFEPHLPYRPPDPERARLLRPGADRERVERLSRLGHPEEMRYILGMSDLTEEDLALLNDLYDGEIAYVDRRVGEILTALRATGILDETIVAVTADHGENIGDHHLMDHKMSVHDTLLHVPLVLRYPGSIAPGQTIGTPVQLHDLHPTLLALARVPPPAGVTVESVPLPGAGIEKAGRGEADPIVGEFVGPPVEFLKIMKDLFPGSDASRFDRTLVALRRGGYKIHWGSDGRHALYHVAEDPGETRDLAGQEPARLQDMTRAVEEWLRRPSRSRR